MEANGEDDYEDDKSDKSSSTATRSGDDEFGYIGCQAVTSREETETKNPTRRRSSATTTTIIASSRPTTFQPNHFCDRSTLHNDTNKFYHRPKGHVYGLPMDSAQEHYPTLYQELNDYYEFMTMPSVAAQEAPLRTCTAQKYLQHAQLFLGWYVREKLPTLQSQLLHQQQQQEQQQEPPTQKLHAYTPNEPWTSGLESVFGWVWSSRKSRADTRDLTTTTRSQSASLEKNATTVAIGSCPSIRYSPIRHRRPLTCFWSLYSGFV
jgi:hypothetical protein